MENNRRHTMKTLILLLCVIGAATELQAQLSASIDTTAVRAAYANKKFKVKPYVDSVLVQQAGWTTDTVLVKGNAKCGHGWLTEFESQKYADAPDSLQSVLNPKGERVVQERCIICGRRIIKSETITSIWKKK